MREVQKEAPAPRQILLSAGPPGKIRLHQVLRGPLDQCVGILQYALDGKRAFFQLITGEVPPPKIHLESLIFARDGLYLIVLNNSFDDPGQVLCLGGSIEMVLDIRIPPFSHINTKLRILDQGK